MYFLSGDHEFCTNIHLDQKLAIHNKDLVEKSSNSPHHSPHSPLKQAVDIGKSVKGHFDWDNHLDVLKKVQEEMAELDEAIKQKTLDDAFDEMGDVLFTLAQLARHLGFSPFDSLCFALKKHEMRYKKMIQLISDESLELSKMSLDEMEVFWVESKKQTRGELQKLLLSFTKEKNEQNN